MSRKMETDLHELLADQGAEHDDVLVRVERASKGRAGDGLVERWEWSGREEQRATHRPTRFTSFSTSPAIMLRQARWVILK